MRDALKLRGAKDVLSRALMHVGREYTANGMWRSYPVDEWGTGDYLNPAIAKANKLLHKALWEVEREFEKC
jgi:hypothetical protein